MTIAFVLGNGKSRLAVDLNSLRPHGKVYGCNALYREFTPDVLVATDPGISGAIQDSGYAKDNVFYTRKPDPKSGARLITEHFGFSSGPIALNLAIRDKHSKIFMLGFDLDGDAGKFNNVYADTEFYKKSIETETYWGNWEQQVAQITRGANAQIVRVNDSHVVPAVWARLLRHVSIQDFIAAINNCKLEQL